MRRNMIYILPILCLLSISSCGANNSPSTQSSTSTSTSTTSSTESSSKTSSSIIRPSYRKNPLIELDMPDPCIIRSEEDKYFYIFSTEGLQRYDGISAERSYIPIMRSRNMDDYEYVGSVFETRPKWVEGVSGVWAPDVIRYKGKYYCYYTMGMWGGNLQRDAVGVAVADRLDGEWTDYGKVLSGEDEGYGSYWNGSVMDACVVEYNGVLHMFFGSFAGIYGIPLSEDGLSVKQGAKAELIVGGSKEGTRTGDFEGSYIRKINGHWYFMGSHGSCCNGVKSTYSVWAMVSTSDSPYGPYVFYNTNKEPVPGLKTKADSPTNAGNLVIGGLDQGFKGNRIGYVAGPGHNALFEDDAGEWWILYHGTVVDNTTYGYNTGRILFYDKLLWDDSFEIEMPYVHGVTKYASSFDYEEKKCEVPYLE